MLKTCIGKLKKSYETKTYDILNHMLSLLPHSLIFSYSQTSKLHWNDIENELLSQSNGFCNFNFDVSLQYKNNPYIFLPLVHYTKLHFSQRNGHYHSNWFIILDHTCNGVQTLFYLHQTLQFNKNYLHFKLHNHYDITLQYKH